MKRRDLERLTDVLAAGDGLGFRHELEPPGLRIERGPAARRREA